MKRIDLYRLLFACILFFIVAGPIASGRGLLHYDSSKWSFWSHGIGELLATFCFKALIWELFYRAFFQSMLHANVDAQTFEEDFEQSIENIVPNFGPDYTHLNEDSDYERQRFSVKQNSIGTINSDSSYLNERNEVFGKGGLWGFVSIRSYRHWTAIATTSVFFATASIDYGKSDTSDEVAYWFILFWYGMCSGWLFYQSRHVIWCAVLYSIVLWLGTTMFGVDCGHNHGLCGS